MHGTAFILGATGQTGFATTRRLAELGWRVRAAARHPASPDHWPAALDIEEVIVDRANTAELARALGDGCDVLIDCVAYHRAHAEQLVALGDRIGSVVVLSSVAVYADASGRDFYSSGGQPPDLPLNLTEEQPTVVPSDETYGARKVALEQALLDAGRFPVTVLRPGAVYGRYSHYPREWYFVKRALDRRPYRIIARGGRTRFHTTAAVNLAELISLAADRPGDRILNAGDPRPPTVREIGASIFRALGHEADEILIEGDPPSPSVGDTPWSVPRSVVMDVSAAERQLGYAAVARYADAVGDAIAWMVQATRDADWADVFPYFYANQGDEAFDYDAEDAWVAGAAPVGAVR